MKTSKLKKRTWHYVQNPKDYEIECNLCHGTNIQWSEYEHNIWCYDCKKDVKGTEGVFGGPVPIEAAALLGMRFDCYDMIKKKIIPFKLDDVLSLPRLKEIKPRNILRQMLNTSMRKVRQKWIINHKLVCGGPHYKFPTMLQSKTNWPKNIKAYKRKDRREPLVVSYDHDPKVLWVTIPKVSSHRNVSFWLFFDKSTQ
jgi:hypothetical protein